MTKKETTIRKIIAGSLTLLLGILAICYLLLPSSDINPDTSQEDSSTQPTDNTTSPPSKKAPVTHTSEDSSWKSGRYAVLGGIAFVVLVVGVYVWWQMETLRYNISILAPNKLDKSQKETIEHIVNTLNAWWGFSYFYDQALLQKEERSSTTLAEKLYSILTEATKKYDHDKNKALIANILSIKRKLPKLFIPDFVDEFEQAKNVEDLNMVITVHLDNLLNGIYDKALLQKEERSSTILAEKLYSILTAATKKYDHDKNKALIANIVSIKRKLPKLFIPDLVNKFEKAVSNQNDNLLLNVKALNMIITVHLDNLLNGIYDQALLQKEDSSSITLAEKLYSILTAVTKKYDSDDNKALIANILSIKRKLPKLFIPDLVNKFEKAVSSQNDNLLLNVKALNMVITVHLDNLLNGIYDQALLQKEERSSITLAEKLYSILTAATNKYDHDKNKALIANILSIKRKLPKLFIPDLVNKFEKAVSNQNDNLLLNVKALNMVITVHLDNLLNGIYDQALLQKEERSSITLAEKLYSILTAATKKYDHDKNKALIANILSIKRKLATLSIPDFVDEFEQAVSNQNNNPLLNVKALNIVITVHLDNLLNGIYDPALLQKEDSSSITLAEKLYSILSAATNKYDHDKNKALIANILSIRHKLARMFIPDFVDEFEQAVSNQNDNLLLNVKALNMVITVHLDNLLNGIYDQALLQKEDSSSITLAEKLYSILTEATNKYDSDKNKALIANILSIKRKLPKLFIPDLVNKFEKAVSNQNDKLLLNVKALNMVITVHLDNLLSGIYDKALLQMRKYPKKTEAVYLLEALDDCMDSQNVMAKSDDQNKTSLTQHIASIQNHLWNLIIVYITNRLKSQAYKKIDITQLYKVLDMLSSILYNKNVTSAGLVNGISPTQGKIIKVNLYNLWNSKVYRNYNYNNDKLNGLVTELQDILNEKFPDKNLEYNSLDTSLVSSEYFHMYVGTNSLNWSLDYLQKIESVVEQNQAQLINDPYTRVCISSTLEAYQEKLSASPLDNAKQKAINDVLTPIIQQLDNLTNSKS